jgi:hypothetical protein
MAVLLSPAPNAAPDMEMIAMTTFARRTPRRRTSFLRALAPLGCVALGGCSPAEDLRLAALDIFKDPTSPRTERLATAPGPIAQPPAPLAGSFTATDLLTGETLRFETRRTGASVRVRQSDGCVWTRSGDWFAPSDSWANCDDSVHWATGRASVRRLASIWPLRPGAEGSWTRDAASHTGRTYTRRTTCRVAGAEAVIREGRAPTPAHLVVCKDGKRTRTTWYAAGEGPVAFRKVHEDSGVEEAWVRR